MNTSPIQIGEQPAATGPRLQLAIDPLILLAALGLVACSLVTLKGAAGTYYFEHQAAYAGSA